MRRVIVESPYKAPTAAGIIANTAYARACVRDCLMRGESPQASHLLLTQPGILRDDVPEERVKGIEAGLAWQTQADCIVVYEDHGITPGMELAIDRARFYNIPIEYRSLQPQGDG
jgi:hypothetical protein